MKTPDFPLRHASAADLDAFYDLFAQVQSIHADAEPDFFRPPERDAAFEEYFQGILGDPEQHLVFACLDGATVGFVLYFLGFRARNIYQGEGRVGYVHGLVIDRQYRRTGCGTVLLEHVKRTAREENIDLLGIDFWSFNGAARSCFQKAGFKVAREFMWLDL
ncbi:MAG: GNAT family N-acetyltransferase [Pseudomonadota bacterium]